MESVRTVYVPVVVYVPVTQSTDDKSKMKTNLQTMKHKSPKTLNNVIKKFNLKTSNQHVNRESAKTSFEPYPKRLRKSTEFVPSVTSEATSSSKSSSVNYYPTAFISNPCDQLFGPQPINLTDDKINVVEVTKEITTSNSSCDKIEHEKIVVSMNKDNKKDFEYIPAPRWSKVQNALLEELYRKGRFPKPSEMKNMAQKLNVMDCDIEEWFRKRRGRDRKTRRKNENLKNMIDDYLHH